MSLNIIPVKYCYLVPLSYVSGWALLNLLCLYLICWYSLVNTSLAMVFSFFKSYGCLRFTYLGEWIVSVYHLSPSWIFSNFISLLTSSTLVLIQMEKNILPSGCDSELLHILWNIMSTSLSLMTQTYPLSCLTKSVKYDLSLKTQGSFPDLYIR